MTAKLSVVVTTHCRCVLLPRALNSLRALGDQVQIVLCADEGTRETRQVATDHLRDGDIFMSLPGYRGPSATRNAGLHYATGDWISFLDDDDTFDRCVQTDILNKLINEDIVYISNYRKLFEQRPEKGAIVQTRVTNKRTNRKPFAELEVRNFVPLSTIFAPRELASQVRFDPDLSISEDWEYLLQLKRLAKLEHMDAFAANWHIEEEGRVSRDSGGKKKRAESAKRIYDKHPTTDPVIEQARLQRLRELGGL